MSGENSKEKRRSTRLSIPIAVVISGLDAEGNSFSENVRTLIVNKHGGKIAMAHRLATGAEVLIENRALGVAAKASVVWWGEKQHSEDLHRVGLQLHEAQDVWGIEFPPEDWRSEPGKDAPPPRNVPPPAERAATVDAATRTPSLASEEISIHLLQELQTSADAHAREFQDRLEGLTRRLGWEVELDLRKRAADMKAREVGALEEEVKVLRESLSHAREEMGKFAAKLQELQCGLEATKANPPPPPDPLPEARRQLAVLANSIVESMNRAAEAGLSEYRKLLEKENQESAARLRPDAGKKAPLPGSSSPKS